MDLVALYTEARLSLPQIEQATGVPRSTVRRRLQRAGVELRSSAAGVRLARPRLGSGWRGKRRALAPEHVEKIRAARRARPARGIRLTSQGYVAYTCGPHKGRLVHRVLMEQHLGRKLLRSEVVHHKDHDRAHNALTNLELKTPSAHSREHRLSEGPRRRTARGQFARKGR